MFHIYVIVSEKHPDRYYIGFFVACRRSSDRTQRWQNPSTADIFLGTSLQSSASHQKKGPAASNATLKVVQAEPFYAGTS
jgi:hypothetical protein